MADNIAVTEGSGKSVRTDDVGGQQVQIIKVAFGGDGVATDVDTGSGLPVAVQGTVTVGSHAVTNAGTFAVQAAQSGTWTVQPGNTANTTAWKVDGSAVTQPISGAVSFTAPQHIIVDSGTVTTVSTVSTITNVVHVDDNSGSLTVDGTVAVSGLSGTSAVKGGTASDAALANAPVTIGGRATNTNLAEMSADGDVVDQMMTMQGALVTADAPRELLGNQQTQISASTSETTIVTAASAVYNDLYGLILANTGGTPTKVSIRDDTAGTVRAIVYVPATETRGFMVPAGSAVSQTATNKNWTAQCSAATTALEVTALFVKRK